MSDDEEELKQLRNMRNPQPNSKREEETKEIEKSEEEEEEERQLKQFNLPTSFGVKKEDKTFQIPLPKKKVVGPSRSSSSSSESVEKPESNSSNSIEPIDSDFIGPPRPLSIENEEEEEQEGVEYTEEDSNYYHIPYSHEIELVGHTKSVSSIALDPSGSRLLTGSHDYDVKFWDFGGMDSNLRSFRTITPSDGNQIVSVDFTPSGDGFLAASASWQIKIYNRDGIELGETAKGDMYLHDQTNTKGHTAAVTKAFYNPTDKTQFVSCSSDSTVRIWDVDTIKRKHKQIIKLKSGTGKTGGTTMGMAPDGKSVIVGCLDGSLQLFPLKGPYGRPSLLIKDAHQAGADITSCKISTDGFTVASRSMDDTLKVWDLRKSKEPLKVFSDLPNFGGGLECMFSPDDQLIITGTAVKKGTGTGLMVFFDKQGLERVKQIGVSPGSSVVSLLWHPKINQIVAGTNEGKVHVLYDPSFSSKGALMCVVKKPRQKDPNDFEPARVIQTPHSLPMFAETPNQKRKEARSRTDPRKSAKLSSGPAAPKTGNSITQHLMKNFITKDQSRDEDPREAILKFAQEAEENPIFMGIYKKTQPKAIFDHTPEQDVRVKPKDSS
eukprot:TRINITY_DN2591_c0_g1_i1.p1 TRINITY_DN2591_c0_g1~~TRINITY_DN2591_c0_g1_i1.p1  ORF type:complete len:607 (+),score=252.56 TRINITY_DN2591_c0_g1_i1:138-1958(+)